MASRYNIVDYDSDDELELSPHINNLISAAEFVIRLLERGNIDYALMGAFVLKCCGSARDTNNIDIVVDTSMKKIWQIIEPESRLVIPQSRLVADVMKIFVKTGPNYDGCSETRLIEVELIAPGSNGTPRDIRNHQQTLVVPSPSGHQTAFKALDVLYLLRSKLDVMAARGAPKDYLDAQFIVGNWRQELERIQEYSEVVNTQNDVELILTPPCSPMVW
ncbi:uncharacterized protein Bfra_008636 [Botrytis fragariae]|uniref:Uncharacterized protein n=1 Tax=Botrytis fragariae TaxID=1964551 RepID=A0A8H6APL9_9HELO|nr:uncharacterized protein Bfra_008636 [Botrytis fragariae]KAF5871613.1 hypothetical protein Bfra_008636 [Botrytis fragariae]